jgi:hypothetical protein
MIFEKALPTAPRFGAPPFGLRPHTQDSELGAPFSVGPKTSRIYRKTGFLSSLFDPVDADRINKVIFLDTYNAI